MVVMILLWEGGREEEEAGIKEEVVVEQHKRWGRRWRDENKGSDLALLLNSVVSLLRTKL